MSEIDYREQLQELGLKAAKLAVDTAEYEMKAAKARAEREELSLAYTKRVYRGQFSLELVTDD